METISRIAAPPAAAIAAAQAAFAELGLDHSLQDNGAETARLVGQITDEPDIAVAAWRDLLDDYPTLPDLWLSYGHALRSTAAKDECIAAYRRAIALEPSYGGAWWALADLKTFRFSQAEIDTTRTMKALRMTEVMSRIASQASASLAETASK